MHSGDVEVRILAVREDAEAGHVVDLAEMTFPRSEPGKSRRLSVFVARMDAAAIAEGVSGAPSPRPMTHDLFLTALEAVDAEVVKVTVVKVVDRVFHSAVTLRRPADSDGAEAASEVDVDSRTSDALALASRCGCPIFVAAEVMESAGYEEESPADIGADAVLAEFRDFIDNVSPEDFE